MRLSLWPLSLLPSFIFCASRKFHPISQEKRHASEHAGSGRRTSQWYDNDSREMGHLAFERSGPCKASFVFSAGEQLAFH